MWIGPLTIITLFLTIRKILRNTENCVKKQQYNVILLNLAYNIIIAVGDININIKYIIMMSLYISLSKT